ncbi:4-coumarate--CoA ligase, partial [Linderina pennispora]
GSNLPDGLNDVAAVLAPNDIAFSAIHFGTLIAGGTYMAVNPQQSVQALAHQLKDVGARVVFTTARLLPVLQQVCDTAGLDIPTSNIVLIQGCSDGFTTLDTAIDGAAAIEPHGVTDPEELTRVALIVYSSGTTGKAKGIMLTHRNIVSMYVMVGGYSARSHAHGDSDSAASVQPQSNVLSALPLYFLYGHCVLCYQPLTSGDLIVQMAGFELDPYLAAIDSYKINRLSLTPAVLYDIAAGITKMGGIAQSAATGNRYDIGSVKMVGCGGASLPHALKKSYSQLLNGSPIIQGYGMA